MMGTSPLSGALVRLYGTRPVAFLGAVVLGVGMSLASLSTQLWHVTLSYGVLTGMGFSLAYVPSIVVLAHFWDVRRSLATGIAVAGSGSGTLVMAAVTDALLRSYSWKQAMLFEGLAGLFLVSMCALAYSPPPSSAEATPPQSDAKRLEATDSQSGDGASPVASHATQNALVASFSSEASVEDTPPLTPLRVDTPPKPPVEDTPPPLGEDTPPTPLGKDMQQQGMSTIDPPCHPDSPLMHSQVAPMSDALDAGGVELSDTHPPLGGANASRSTSSGIESDAEPGSLSRGHASGGEGGNCYGTPDIPADSQHEQGGVLPDQQRATQIHHKETLWQIVCRLWNIRKFRCLVFALGPNALGYLTPFTHLKAYAISPALELSSANASLALSAIGIASVVGRVLMGRVADMSIGPAQPHIVRNWLFLLSGFGSALSVAGMGVAASVGGLVAASLGFGVFSGAILSVMPVITADAVGVADLPVALPIMYFVQVPGFLVGAPIAGWVKVAADSYRPAFALSGGLMVLGACALLPLAWDVSPRADARRAQTKIEDDETHGAEAQRMPDVEPAEAEVKGGALHA